MPGGDKTEWLSKAEVGAYLGVTLGWVRESMETGRLPYYKLGRYVRFRRQDIDTYVEEQRRVGMGYGR